MTFSMIFSRAGRIGKAVATLEIKGAIPGARINGEKKMSGLVEITTADELASWLKRMNLSISAAADQLGRKRATITRYINGETDLPESVGRHAAVIEAARKGQPFESRRRGPRPSMAFR